MVQAVGVAVLAALEYVGVRRRPDSNTSRCDPSIILLDLLLPGMNGFELCRRLRSEALTRNTPIVLVTAKVFDKDIAAGAELGIDDYIVKPFSVGDVVGRVSSLLQARLIQKTR